MNWYLAKIVYQITCGEGLHTAQFDEQLRLVSAIDSDSALHKARTFGAHEAESFFNVKQELVSWTFIAVSELIKLDRLTDGAEVYSQVNEVEDEESYLKFVKFKETSLRQNESHKVLNLI